MASTTITKRVAKPKLPAVNKSTIAGISTASFTTLMRNGEIKKLTEFITRRNKDDPYNPKSNKYYKKVVFYERVEKPLTKTGKKSFKYVRIPEENFDEFDLKKESTPLTLSEYTFQLNNALTRYSKNVKVHQHFY